MSDHRRPVEIAPAVIERWRRQAARLGGYGFSLQLELRRLGNDPSCQNIGRAIRSSRYLGNTAPGDLALIAKAIATELEFVAGLSDDGA